MKLIAMIGLVALVGIGGMFSSRRSVRLVFWVLAVAPFGLGMFALIQGGIAEPFSSRQMWAFCAVTFWPVVGCVLGECFGYRRSMARRTREGPVKESVR